MDNVVIRKATVDDVDRLTVLENDCFTTDKISKRQMRYLISKAKAITLVAEQQNQLLGYCVCFVPMQPRPARLYSLAVLAESRGKGVAKQLISRLFLLLKEQQRQRCRLEVRESQHLVQALYKNYGFTEVLSLPDYYEDGESALRMEVTLAKS